MITVFDGEEFLKGQSAFVGAQHAAPLRQSHLKFTTCTTGYIHSKVEFWAYSFELWQKVPQLRCFMHIDKLMQFLQQLTG